MTRSTCCAGSADLEELTIGDTRSRRRVLDVDVAAVAHVVARRPRASTIRICARSRQLTSLIALDLSATEIADPSALAALPNLRVLGLAETRLSKAGLDAVEQLDARGIEIKR